MNAGELCNREVVFAYRNTPLVDAARLMREHHVGSLVVVVDRQSERVPVGMITDRDIVVAVVAKQVDPRNLTVGDVAAAGLLAVHEKNGIPEVLRMMREHGVRRLPVLTHSGALAGILAIDDLLELMAEELAGFARTIDRERVHEARARR